MGTMHTEYQGIKITAPADCGNAPKKKFLYDFIMAAATNDFHFISEHASDDICWNIVNDNSIQGLEELANTLKAAPKITEVEILNIITHGKTASVNGTVKFEDHHTDSFCNVYTFVSAGNNTIKEIISYIIKMD
ncbi:hypothetical protein [Bacillus sp. UMB0728]|uniref:hypothetical protein n=1 Tax=Bacillus sp. UMB0728 TaxID=2066052 RepID=UPI000C784B73|nr:hypothetical protein [Bacillus sp. UMB0728]PLR73201.1 hypothetical protein CYJ37_06515 [Bacillus sp. UMB0728]